MIKAAFLDRDGVINRKAPENGYIIRWEDMQILPGVASGIALLNRAGFNVILVTNQRCIAKGLLTADQLEAMHKNMCEELSHAGARIDAIYYCPHEKWPPCKCRKPRPGMLFEAARTHGIYLRSSWMIGDSQIDLEAGKAAGCKTALLMESDPPKTLQADVVARSLLEAVRGILHGTASVTAPDRNP